MTDETVPQGEPLIHSHWTDVLPEEHPLAYRLVDCARCKSMVHCDNNECMQTWVEWGQYALCGDCFIGALKLMDGVMNWREFEDYCNSAERRSEEP